MRKITVHVSATWRIWLNDPCTAAMRPCIKLLLPLADTVRMRSMVYETVGRPSVCPSFRLSVPSFDRRTPLLRICCCGPGEQETSIDCSTANASSIKLSAEVRSWIRTCFCPRDAMLARVLAMVACPCLSVSVSVCHKSVFYQKGWTDQSGFWHRAFFDLSYTVF